MLDEIISDELDDLNDARQLDDIEDSRMASRGSRFVPVG